MIYEFLDEVGTDEFFNVDTTRVDEFINEHIVQNPYTEENPEDTMLSSAAFLHIYDELMASIEDLKSMLEQLWLDVENFYDWYYAFGIVQRIEFITGPIRDRVPNPEPCVMYVQHDNMADDSYTVYFYVNDEWRSVMDPDEIVKNCVKYDEIEEYKEWLRSKLIGSISDERIAEIANEEWNSIGEG